MIEKKNKGNTYKDNDEFKKNKLELGIITINLSNLRNPDGTQLCKVLT